MQGSALKFSTKVLRADRSNADCVVVGVFANGRLSRAADVVNKASRGRILELINSGDVTGKLGEARLFLGLSGIMAPRLLIVGLGKSESLTETSWKEVVQNSIKSLLDTGATVACLFLTDIEIKKRDLEWKSRQFCVIATATAYRFDSMKSTKPAAHSLTQLVLGVSSGDLANAKTGIKQGCAIAAGMNLAKDLGNLPGNLCTPSYLAEQAKKLGTEWKLSVKVFEQKDIERLGMGAMLSVAKGSRQPPKFIVAKYLGASRNTKPIVLVGKGITFDSGGVSLKPGAGMDEMKFDMCGAAAVLGTIRAVSELRLRLNLVALIPATENMPDGAASKPGDIVTSMSGQTIEILNTDAEGRLILCDALTYAERFEPSVVVDVATLTGACIVALGHACSGVFSNRDDLAQELVSAGEEALDRAWQLPLWDEYLDDLKSNFADIANVGGRAAGSITAAAFLSKFSGKFSWAHLDIAGTAWVSGKGKGATARPVPLLVSFLMNRAQKAS